MKFNEYVEFNNFLKTVDLEMFTAAANKANFVDNNFIGGMYESFTDNPSDFITKNREGIMFDYFYNEFKKN